MSESMRRYYSRALAAERLRACYELAPPAVRAYLQAEVDFVLAKVAPSHRALELGCGYGRVLQALVPRVREAVGIDTSRASLELARRILGATPSCSLLAMDAARMGFGDRSFDAVICIQNGIAVFGVDPQRLMEEALRVTRRGGTVLFSSYSERFWEHRLEWFRAQAEHGLVGRIDERATGDGVIVCEDGFRATTVTKEEFLRLAGGLHVAPAIAEVGGSSLFCEIAVP